MNNKNASNHDIASEGLEFYADTFIAELTAEGYARGSLSTKRAALRRYPTLAAAPETSRL